MYVLVSVFVCVRDSVLNQPPLYHHRVFFLCNAVKCVNLPGEQSCKLWCCCFVSHPFSLCSLLLFHTAVLFTSITPIQSPSSFKVTSLTALFPSTAALKLQAVRLSSQLHIDFMFDCPYVQTVAYRLTLLKSHILK